MTKVAQRTLFFAVIIIELKSFQTTLINDIYVREDVMM